MLPSDHRLAAHDAIELRELVGETFIIPSKTAPTSRVVIEDYFKALSNGTASKPASAGRTGRR